MFVSFKGTSNQDRIQPHTASAVLNALYQHLGISMTLCFPAHLICGWSWSANYLDLSPSDFFLWVFLKDTVHKNEPHTIQEMKQEIW